MLELREDGTQGSGLRQSSVCGKRSVRVQGKRERRQQKGEKERERENDGIAGKRDVDSMIAKGAEKTVGSKNGKMERARSAG